MTTITYADIQTAGDGWFASPTEYTLQLGCGPYGSSHYVEVSPDSSNPTRFTVEGIPSSMLPAQVALHLNHIMIAVHPDRLMWSAVAALPRGSVVNSRREGRLVVVDDAAHWTGRRCIGWMRDHDL